MAFKFFKRREQQDENRETVLGQPGTVSDVLLTAIMRGEKINRAQALTIPTIAANVDFITSTIASMPIKLYKYTKGKVEEVEGDDRVRLLNSDTGDTLDAYQMKQSFVEDYLLDKGGYIYIKKNRNRVTGLYYVDPVYVVINYNYQPINKSYVIYCEEKQYKPWEFLKLLRRTKTGAFGTGIIEEINDALATAYQTQLYQLGLVKKGGNKRGFLKSERKLGQEEIDTLKAAWRNLYSNNDDNVVVLNNGIDFKEASNNSVELQLNQSIRSLADQFDKIFHIFPNFYDTFKFGIYPIVRALETALNRDLLLEKEKGRYFFEVDVKEIIRANIKERYEVYKLAKDCGMMTTNEMRRAENMNEVDGLDVVNVGLGAVLYDTKNHVYYTPNTDTTTSIDDAEKSGAEETPEEVKLTEEESFIDEHNGSEV